MEVLPKVVIIFVGIFAVLKFSLAQETDPDIDPDVEFVLVGMRHGNRNPGTMQSWYLAAGLGTEGPLMLTKKGMEQAYGLGEKLQERYGGSEGIIPAQFNNTRVKGYSSSAERCQMTLQTMFYGLFYAGTAENGNFGKWSPVPYKIDNMLLRMYAIDECDPQKDGWETVDNEETQWLKDLKSNPKNRELLDYVAKNVNGKSSFGTIADVADNLMNLEKTDANVPQWVNSANLSGDRNGKNIYDDIVHFAETPQIACAKYEECGKMMGGHWLNVMIGELKKAKKGVEVKSIYYASHTEITLSVMYLMGVNKSEVKEMPTSGGFIIEYKPRDTLHLVRMIYHEPDETNPMVRHLQLLTVCNSTKQIGLTENEKSKKWCLLDEWTNSVQKNSISDIEEECGIAQDNGSDNFQISVQLFGFLLAFALSQVAMGCMP